MHAFVNKILAIYLLPLGVSFIALVIVRVRRRNTGKAM